MNKPEEEVVSSVLSDLLLSTFATDKSSGSVCIGCKREKINLVSLHVHVPQICGVIDSEKSDNIMGF